MKLEELAPYYTGCNTYEAQYLPTFKRILHEINSEDVLDIIKKYNEYKPLLQWVNSTAKQKHIKSLRDKLSSFQQSLNPPQQRQDATAISESNPPQQHQDATAISESNPHDSTDTESEEDASDVSDDLDMAIDIKKYQKYRAFFKLTIKYVHQLPPDVIVAALLIGFDE